MESKLAQPTEEAYNQGEYVTAEIVSPNEALLQSIFVSGKKRQRALGEESKDGEEGQESDEALLAAQAAVKCSYRGIGG